MTLGRFGTDWELQAVQNSLNFFFLNPFIFDILRVLAILQDALERTPPIFIEFLPSKTRHAFRERTLFRELRRSRSRLRLRLRVRVRLRLRLRLRVRLRLRHRSVVYKYLSSIESPSSLPTLFFLSSNLFL